ncbi:hypothetical protein [Mycolicibacter heraklionensis]|uniref:hypothetical protein n=1 Tax=Mycolicibacter heraklionensis TaxID=512402 RepID=UPI00069B1C79|nr:hypothetical protein [Mycolicibacter heraklionensis]
MARDAVLKLLRGDQELADLGGEGFEIETNWSYDQRPNDKGPFIVLTWRPTDFSVAIQGNAGHHFNIWVHLPSEVSTDYVRIDDILDRIDEIFDAAADEAVAGDDGRQLDCVQRHGRSPDLTDEDYRTICRYGAYEAFSHKT